MSNWWGVIRAWVIGYTTYYEAAKGKALLPIITRGMKEPKVMIL